MLEADPQALVIRSSAFFGPWDEHNFVSQALSACERGEQFAAAGDLTMSPTYVPDLVNTCLDLLIDREKGIWHLSNGTAVTWAQLTQLAAEVAGVDSTRLEEVLAQQLCQLATRPAHCARGSERGVLMPPLADALERYAGLRKRGSGISVGDCSSGNVGGGSINRGSSTGAGDHVRA